MNITPKVKQYLVENCGLKADATELEAKAALGDALVGGKLTAEKLAELTKADASEGEARVKALVEETVTKAMNPILEAIKGLKGGDGAETATKGVNLNPANNPPAGDAAQVLADAQKNAGGSAGEAHIRVKSVLENFSASTTTATFDKGHNPFLSKSFAGVPVQRFMENPCYTLDMPSERSKAIAGAWFKHMVIRAKGGKVPAHMRLTELDRKLVEAAAHECKFVGPVDFNEERDDANVWYEGQKLTDVHIKALLDDTTSGGLEAVPIEFDAAVILTPLLNGELFPLVNIRNVTRRRIEAAAIGNPTMSWGVGEGSTISLFNTDSFVSAFDNNIYPVTGAMELGLDFLADSPLSVASIVIDRYGERFRQVMDNVIATGNGTNQPTGIFTTSGVSVVPPAGGNGAAQTVGDYESLMFGVGKEYLQEAGMPPNSRAVFLGTQTSYQRARALKVNSSSDERRIFGMDEMSYRLFGFRYAINGSLTNAQIGFACLNRYRMYRRQGLEVRIVTEDATLARQNKQLILVRARFGGNLELSGAAAKITAGQA